jgi:hypothetical protein
LHQREHIARPAGHVKSDTGDSVDQSGIWEPSLFLTADYIGCANRYWLGSLGFRVSLQGRTIAEVSVSHSPGAACSIRPINKIGGAS